LLLRQGYTVLATGSPTDALRLAGEHPGDIHLLITDVIMPEMNGRILAESLKSKYPDIKCLFMSGYPADIVASQGILDKGVSFIQKPFSVTDLTDKLAAVFR
jgi:CheY-like chemotaxis protein